MIFSGAYGTLRREGTVVIGGNILVSDEGGEEEVGELRGGFVV
jgi:hypothetical protein